jgi:hypothetical protein
MQLKMMCGAYSTVWIITELCPPGRRRRAQLSVSPAGLDDAMRHHSRPRMRPKESPRIESLLLPGDVARQLAGGGPPGINPECRFPQRLARSSQSGGASLRGLGAKAQAGSFDAGMRRGPSRATSRRWGADHRWRDSRGCSAAAPERGAWLIVSLSGKAPLPNRPPGTRTPPRQLWKGSCGGVLLDRPARLWGVAGRTVPT